MPSAASPLFSWLDHRASGVLLHPTALPGDFGIGTLDAHADRFLDFLAAAGFRYWQICPLGPTGYGDSPYQSFSSFAGNPYLIDLQPLLEAGLLSRDALEPLAELPHDRVDFGGIWQRKWPVLFAAAARFLRRPVPLPYGPFDAFCVSQASWLDDFSYFLALKEHFEGRPWWEWPEAYRMVEKARHAPLHRELASRIAAHQFLQYLFFGQWRRLRERARSLGISLIGDLPIFVAMDSADAWSNPTLFRFDKATRRPSVVAGVPPDYFSADGQLWGNPLYDWAQHKKNGYDWWTRRLGAAFALAEVVRIDHFRGFESYWAVPAGAPNARAGKWEPGPGLALFGALKAAFPNGQIVAEDLGLLTPGVTALREATGLPGMAILQFAFGGNARNAYLPHNLTPNCVLYPGTHDNDTTRHWFATAPEATRDHVRRYFRIPGDEIAWDFIRAAYASVCRLAILPLQDLLSLGTEARFNTPGRPDGNWSWRFRSYQLDELARHSTTYLRELGLRFGRIAEPESAKQSPPD